MALTQDDLRALAEVAEIAAIKAGELVAEHADRPHQVNHKPGGETLAAQVVTEVDLLSDGVIFDHLQPTCEQYGLALLSEERDDSGERLEREAFWCIDPIDGTLPFIESKPGYAVSIALVARSGEPLIGAMFDPTTHTLYSSVKGEGASHNGRPWSLTESPPANGVPFTVACDRSLATRSDFGEIEAALARLARAHGWSGLELIHDGGAVMNACWVAERRPGCYFKLPRAEGCGGSLWDVAATAALFSELGGWVGDCRGGPLDLNRADSTYINRGGALFVTEPRLAGELCALLAPYLEV